jgi:hypothetical protein
MDRGAFRVPLRLPSRCIVEADASRVAGAGVTWRYELTACDLRYARVLRNNLYAFEQLEEVSLSVQVEQSPRATSRYLLAVDEAAVEREEFYPAAPTKLPFAYETEDSDRGDKGRRVVLEFASPIDGTLEAEIVALLRLWERVVGQGYPSSEEALRAGEYGVMGISGGVFDEFSYEIGVEIFWSPEAAWYPLLKLLAAMAPERRCTRVTLT